MVPALCRVHGAKCSGTAHSSGPNSDSLQFEFTQVMKASEMSYLVDTPDYYSTPYHQMQEQAPVEDEVIVVPEKFRHIFFGYDDTEFAGMAPPLPANRPDDDLSGLLTVDCGATTTLTDSLNNMTNVQPKVVTIQLAMAGATMR